MNFWPLQNKKIWIAGHAGMVGQALLRRLEGKDCVCLTAPRAQLDLRRQAEVEEWVAAHKPDAILIAAATVGGIADNAARPADYLFDNLTIAANIVGAAHRCDVGRIVYLGSSCIYPRDAAQPITEDMLLTGLPEPTNEAYAMAKIAGIKLCESYSRQHGRAYFSAIPCNLYGPGDRYDAFRSHVIPALVMKFHAAKAQGLSHVALWGTGAPLREFLHVDDLADAIVHLLTRYSGVAPVNVGSGVEVSIRDLAGMIASCIGFEGDILFDPAMPDGTPRKLMDSSAMRGLGWAPRIDLRDGLRQICAAYAGDMLRLRAA